VLPRLLELVAKRGLVPDSWRSARSGASGGELAIEIRMSGLGQDTVDYIAACMRQIASVRTVFASEARAAAFE
jgi:hypothetical protein